MTTKITVVGCLLFALVALDSKPAAAANNPNCTVSGVAWQKYSAAVPTDMLTVNCSDGTAYAAYIGTSTQVSGTTGCYVTADGVKAYESLALAARLSNHTLNIWWTTHSCPGNSNQRIIDMMTIQ